MRTFLLLCFIVFNFLVSLIIMGRFMRPFPVSPPQKLQSRHCKADQCFLISTEESYKGSEATVKVWVNPEGYPCKTLYVNDQKIATFPCK